MVRVRVRVRARIRLTVGNWTGNERKPLLRTPQSATLPDSEKKCFGAAACVQGVGIDEVRQFCAAQPFTNQPQVCNKKEKFVTTTYIHAVLESTVNII